MATPERGGPFPCDDRRGWWAKTRPVAMLLLLLLLAPLTHAAPRIGVATMQPGEIFWERFGHNAIVVDDPAAATAVSYNFGFFDLEEADFTGRFGFRVARADARRLHALHVSVHGDA